MPKCGCESSFCLQPYSHGQGRCPNEGTVRCDYVGYVCESCAKRMEETGGAEYIHRDDTHDSTGA